MNAPEPALIPSRSFDELHFQSGFGKLSPAFHSRVEPARLDAPYLVGVSAAAAALIGLEAAELRRPQVIDILAGNTLAKGSVPIATVYSGHQFGHWAGQLGDGRALLLGQLPGISGDSWEIQLKGAGLTPYSRMGDGRAVLRSSIREFLCSEAMDALGIPSTRALAIIGADTPVFRESVETAAVVTRMAPSFLRFGHFEHFYYAGRHDELRQLADYLIDHFYPQLRDEVRPFQALLREITRKTASLVAQWQSVGFCHGVMNTDNMSVLGLTIDYGPFGFLDAFDPQHICNHSDSTGRYSYANQPGIAEWNCYCLGQAMMPLLESVDLAKEALEIFRPTFAAEFSARFAAKLGLAQWRDPDDALLSELFEILATSRVDFTRFFRELARVRRSDAAGDSGCRDLFLDPSAFDGWATKYRQRLSDQDRSDSERADAMNRVNPVYVLRNHLAEIAIQRARGGNERVRLGLGASTPVRTAQQPAELSSGQGDAPDYSEMATLLEALRSPFEERAEFRSYAEPPPEWAAHLQVSCSS